MIPSRAIRAGESQFPRPQMQEIGRKLDAVEHVVYGTVPVPNRVDMLGRPDLDATRVVEIKPEEGTPWFELRLPWEKEPSFWRHPLQSNRWRRRHYRILSLERSLGIHSKWHEDVLPWCPRHGDMMC